MLGIFGERVECLHNRTSYLPELPTTKVSLEGEGEGKLSFSSPLADYAKPPPFVGSPHVVTSLHFSELLDFMGPGEIESAVVCTGVSAGALTIDIGPCRTKKHDLRIHKNPSEAKHLPSHKNNPWISSRLSLLLQFTNLKGFFGEKFPPWLLYPFHFGSFTCRS